MLRLLLIAVIGLVLQARLRAEDPDRTVREFIEAATIFTAVLEQGSTAAPPMKLKAALFSNYFSGLHRTMRLTFPELIDFKLVEQEQYVHETIAMKLRMYPRIQELPATAFVISVYFSEWGTTESLMRKGLDYLEHGDGRSLR